MIEWNLEEIPIKQIKDHPKNPRQITKDQMNQLSNTIDEFGLIDKPILNTDFTLIGGHQRIKILKKRKYKAIKCWIPNRQLTENEVDKLCIKLNKHHGSWDWDIMANEWDPITLLESGFTEDELMGTYEKYNKEVTEQNSKETKNSSKKKSCPNCGHEF